MNEIVRKCTYFVSQDRTTDAIEFLISLLDKCPHKKTSIKQLKNDLARLSGHIFMLKKYNVRLDEDFNNICNKLDKANLLFFTHLEQIESHSEIILSLRDYQEMVDIFLSKP